jgi:SAM-dependent methyltransferase
MANNSRAEKLAALDPEKRRLLQKILAQKQEAAPKPSAQFEPDALHSFYSHSQRTKEGTQKFYDVINDQLDASIFGACSAFLNYGYAANDSAEFSPICLPRDLLNRTSVKLVLEMIGDCDLSARRVLDVGCGRGGTLAVVNQYFSTRSTTGIDLSPRAVAFCRKTHHFPNCHFEEGDAEHLPFSDAAFDIVLNLESSHSYLDIDAFYREVKRVLPPGGFFLYADVFGSERFDHHEEALSALDFGIEQRRDITVNALLSCRQTAQLRSQAFTPQQLNPVLDDFLSTPGSSVFQEMESGRASYRILKLRRR